MTPERIYNMICVSNYRTSGEDVQWTIANDPSERVIHLIFQQSASKIDWKVNLDFPVRPYKQQKNTLFLHRGWADAWKSCNDEVMNALIATVNFYKDYTVEIDGWSYGGAMSVIAAEDLHFRTGIKPDIVTFGAPNPLFGLKTFLYVKSCCGTVHQYAHVNDVVPLMPPVIGYCQVKKTKVGKGFSLIKLFKPQIYHCIYGESSLYEDVK